MTVLASKQLALLSKSRRLSASNAQKPTFVHEMSHLYKMSMSLCAGLTRLLWHHAKAFHSLVSGGCGASVSLLAAGITVLDCQFGVSWHLWQLALW